MFHHHRADITLYTCPIPETRLIVCTDSGNAPGLLGEKAHALLARHEQSPTDTRLLGYRSCETKLVVGVDFSLGEAIEIIAAFSTFHSLGFRFAGLQKRRLAEAASGCALSRCG
jgi:hypothetical protein